MTGTRTRVELGRREDLGADCANCFGLCCVALAFTRSADFPVDKPAGEPCTNLDTEDACTIHRRLRPEGFAGCTVFDCFGAGQKVSMQTFGGVSWRSDAEVRARMFAVFPLMRRLHELLWYLDVALGLREVDAALRDAVRVRFDAVHALTLADADAILAADVDAEYGAARPLLIAASAAARHDGPRRRRHGRLRLQPGADLVAAALAGADLRGADLRGSMLIAADLRGADLRGCDVLGADLRDADVAGADLSTAIYLTQAQVSSTRGDARTALPPDFERPSHWAASTGS
ncbi:MULTISPECIES: pentapeptide repeat-containing protein [unclassified Rathayibacter]|uniref:pentapeptide repeat-containing protein n=1 Tax=unclassified Rathayibacter TaxID=2609250 RepID=UPI000F4B25DC|nr:MULTISPECIES: pentapeptide repeat-containing protein [unclassified Rathayibacter]ROP56925.1 pentapeptide repeat protein [Rathayibacter sp. PhB186]ROS55310.1 pentapeptide repeat protein [Rathayibacter sp. PhB185]